MSSEVARLAAVHAALERIESGMTIGLGSGRAVFALVAAIAQRWKTDVPIRAVVASPRTATLADDAGIPVVDLTNDITVDLAIDGADEVDANLGLVKGGGAALLREKLIIAAAARVIIVAEESKRVERLGQTRRLPVDIVPFGWETTLERVRSLCPADLRLDEGSKPLVTADGHFLLEAEIPQGDLRAFAGALKGTLGVVDHGLFLDEADEAILGLPDGSTDVLHRSPAVARPS